MLIREHNGYRHVFTRANYTRRVWKANHYAFGNRTPGCWNTVHCGPRDSTYTLAHSQATVAACEIMKISRAEFQFFFEKTDQNFVYVHIEPNEVRFNWKGKTHIFTRGTDKNKVIATLRELELYGNADAERKIAKANQVKVVSEAKQAKRAAAVARTARLMRPDYVKPEKSEPERVEPPKNTVPVTNPTLPAKPVLPHCAEIKYGCPMERVPEFREWCKPYHKELLHVKLPQRIAMFLEATSAAALAVELEDVLVDLLTLAQMFAPMPEFPLLTAPQSVLLEPEPVGAEEDELEEIEPLYNQIYVVDEVKAAAEREEADYDEEKAPTVVTPIPETGNLIQPRPVLKLKKPGVRKPRKSRMRKLVERNTKADVPFYGMRRRTQAQFRDDVALNCFDRCVVSGASLIRCEAAHLLAHARKGGASFKNGLLLRADLHTLFDAGECAIDPQAMTIHFSLSILASDPELVAYEGRAINTLKKINHTNLEERWVAFLTIYMETDTAV